MRRLVLCTLLVTGAPTMAVAQTSVRIEVDKSLVALGDEIQISVHIAVDGRGYQGFQQPALTGFRITAAGMTSQNIEMINWRIRRRETRVMTALAEKEGRQTIGPAAIQVDGRLVRSNRVVVVVKRGAGGLSSRVPPKADDDEDTLGARPTPGSGTGAADDALGTRGPLFLHATATPTRVFVGQQIVATWRLFAQTNVIGFQHTKSPATDNFWSEELRGPTRLEFSRQLVGGRVYYVAPLTRRALFAQKAGKLTIGPMGATVRTIDDLLSASRERQSDPLTIEVRALPAQGRPQDFAEQNVGQFEVAAALDRTTIAAGDAVTLKVIVRGRGNLRQFKIAALPALDGFKAYDPKISERLELENGVSGERVFEYLLLPTRGGELKIPALKVDYFDPATERYQVARTQPLSLRVTGRVSSAPGAAAANVLGPDIRPPRPATTLRDQAPFSIYHPLWIVLAALPLGLVTSLMLTRHLRDRLRQPSARSLERAASRRVREHLRRAEALCRASTSAEFFGELTAALQEQLRRTTARRAKEPIVAAALTRDELREQLVALSYDAAFVQRLIEELDNCDFGRFAPSAGGEAERLQALHRARALVQELS